MTLNQLRKFNKHIKIRGITNLSFKKYGRIVTGYDFTEMIKYMEDKTPIPEEGNIYISSVEALEELEVFKRLQNNYFGELEMQAGYCNGVNSKLHYLQYHKSNELILAVTDMIIFLGKLQDISEGQYDLKRIEAYFVPEGVAVELYSTTLHSAPCRIELKGFKCLILSINGTGAFLRYNNNENEMIVSKNKWGLAHQETENMNGRVGLLGENTEIFIR